MEKNSFISWQTLSLTILIFLRLLSTYQINLRCCTMVALKIKEGMYGVKDVTVERKEIQT